MWQETGPASQLRNGLRCGRAPITLLGRILGWKSDFESIRRSRCFKIPPTVCAVLLASAPVMSISAQNVVLTGSVGGRITDQTGAVVPEASVVARSLQTGVERTTKTSRAGIYQFPELSPGFYSLTASNTGFRDFQALLQVQVGNTTVQEVKLQVGASKDTVKVNTAGPILRPEESSSTYLLDHTLLPELPLNGRRYTDFTLLSPNTSPDGDTGLVSIAGQPGGEDSGYANGNGSSAFTVDGTNATSNYFADVLGRYRIPYLYGENSIQEFQVTISPYSALYGGAAGFINAVTRSGGNQFHGDIFYYNRNSATGANDAISKASGFPKQYDALQQFGAGVGGPILRNRLWFFVDYEQQRENDPISVINPPVSAANADLMDNFGIPNGTPLPAPNAPYPLPGSVAAPDPTNPVYLQQVSNALNALNSNLGIQPRQKNDLVVTPRLDFQADSRDSMFLTLNINRFDSPGGVITVSPVADYGTQTLANDEVHDFQASLGWTHTFSSTVLNEFHAGTSQDNQIATPTGRAPGMPTIVIDNPSFTLGNAPFSVGRVFERQYSVSDRVDVVKGKHTLQFGFDFSRAWDSDNNFGGADPNANAQFGSFLGSFEFSSLENFALGQYNLFSQAAGNPTFAFAVPYYGFYVQDTYRILPKLTLEMGLREDFQIYPQPAENPGFPLTGQYPNQYQRLAPRFGFAWQPTPKTVVRGGFGDFRTNLNGLNYRNTVVSNGLASQQSSVSQQFDPALNPNQQLPTFPSILPGNSPLFQASSDISLFSPQFRVPYVLQGSLQIEQEIDERTTFTIGTMWNHGVHMISGSAFDANQMPLQGTTTFITCPPNTATAPCAGPQITLPNMDNGLLSDGLISSNFGQINEVISPGQNYYNSLFTQLQHRVSHGVSMQVSYTWAKTMMRDGMDFNNQFDFSNTHGPALLDQRHSIGVAGVYQPQLQRLTASNTGRALLSGWRLSTVMAFASGRPYAGLLAPGSAGNNLNDSAFNQDTANTASGINNAGPTPGIGLNSFYGPWIERIDMGLARSFHIGDRGTLQLQAQAFNLFNHANYYVANGNGVNQIQYNPTGNPGNDTCGDGQSLNQTCYLVPNSGPGNFGALQEISPNGLPRVLQFSARFTF